MNQLNFFAKDHAPLVIGLVSENLTDAHAESLTVSLTEDPIDLFNELPIFIPLRFIVGTNIEKILDIDTRIEENYYLRVMFCCLHEFMEILIDIHTESNVKSTIGVHTKSCTKKFIGVNIELVTGNCACLPMSTSSIFI